jgi:hypothetical protein
MTYEFRSSRETRCSHGLIQIASVGHPILFHHTVQALHVSRLLAEHVPMSHAEPDALACRPDVLETGNVGLIGVWEVLSDREWAFIRARGQETK